MTRGTRGDLPPVILQMSTKDRLTLDRYNTCHRDTEEPATQCGSTVAQRVTVAQAQEYAASFCNQCFKGHRVGRVGYQKWGLG